MLTFAITTLACWLYFILWFAIVQKPLFGIANRKSSSRRLKFKDVAHVYRFGLPTDAIIASYLAAIPLLLTFVFTFIPGANPYPVRTVYNLIVALAIGLLTIADTLLYPFWNFKIDASVFAYLRSLKGATSSVSNRYLSLAFCGWMVLSGLFFFGIQIVIGYIPAAIRLVWWEYPLAILLFVVIAGVMFIIIRGLGIRPNTPSIAWFSNNNFLNHWAVNPGYTILYTLSKKDDYKNRFKYMESGKCDGLIADTFRQSKSATNKILKSDRPNILLIEWESFGAEFSGAFGGKPGITPNFDKLTREGIAFTNCIAGSFRTDRALVCIHSGLPAQPTASVINHTQLLSKLPGLARSLKLKAGYKTLAIHGGDLSIMHKNDYYLASGHDQLIEQKHIQPEAEKCKWGVHDEPMMQRTADEIIRLTADGGSPFFITLQTLSSHEPFDVPHHILDDKVENSYAYTDYALGRMIQRLKASPAWDNLLIVIVADHGLNRSHSVDNRRKFAHIPLLMIGGAIRQSGTVNYTVCQTDIAATLLGQLDIDHNEFPYSRNVLAESYSNPFGFHIFNNGIMIADSEKHTIFDTSLNRVVAESSTAHEELAKAIVQHTYTYLSNLK